jgi:hypothetical protein
MQACLQIIDAFFLNVPTTQAFIKNILKTIKIIAYIFFDAYICRQLVLCVIILFHKCNKNVIKMCINPKFLKTNFTLRKLFEMNEYTIETSTKFLNKVTALYISSLNTIKV